VSSSPSSSLRTPTSPKRTRSRSRSTSPTLSSVSCPASSSTSDPSTLSVRQVCSVGQSAPSPSTATEDPELSRSAIITVDRAGIVKSIDRGGCALFGYTLPELLGHEVKKIIPSPYREQHDSYLEAYHRTGVKKIINKSRLLEGQHKDGTIFPIRLSVSEVSLGATQQLYIGMIERVPNRTVIITADLRGVITGVNASVTEVWGYQPSELVGQNLKVLMPEPHFSMHDHYMAEYQRTGKRKVIGRVRNVPARHKSGLVFPVSLRVDHICKPGVEMYRACVEKVDTYLEAVFTVNDQGVIESCNHNFVMPLFGYDPRDLVGQPLHMLMPDIVLRPELISAIQKHNQKHRALMEETTAEATTLDETSHAHSSSDSVSSSSSSSTASPSCSTAPSPTTSSLDDMPPPTKKIRHNPSPAVTSLPTTSSQTAPRLQNACSFGFQVEETTVVHADRSTFPVRLELVPFLHASGLVYIAGKIRRTASSSNLPSRSVEEMDRNTSRYSSGSTVSQSSSEGIIVGDYAVGVSIGQGSYGKVRVGIHRATNQRVAIKILQKDLLDDAELDRVQREVNILKNLNHPNICKFVEYIETENRIFLILELASGGELFTYVMNNGKLSEPEARRIFTQLADAVAYCHRNNVIHRDIKHKNILLDNEKNVKLIDFGLSNFTKDGDMHATFCGTPAYAAPSMILAQEYTGPEVDVWSLGVVLYAMLSKEFPFKNVSDIIHGNFVDIPSVSPLGCQLIRSMLLVDASKRATMKEVLAHPWMCQGDESTKTLS